MRKRLLAFALAVCMFALGGCGQTIQIDFSGVDYQSSPYKHINNGGVTDDETLPYNVDAITGATLTVEGPGLVTSTPLSIRELENRNDGLVRGVYKDSRGTFIYEGMDLYSLLSPMTDGDNGIQTTEKAYRVQFKDSNRKTISELTLEEIKAAHDAGEPILLAYGIGSTDQETVAPFVFDGKTEKDHSLGYVDKLKNDDGCLRLVYDTKKYGRQNGYKTFSNVAYVYVAEETEPGFKHTAQDGGVYGSADYSQYLIAFRGSALGHEINLTVEQLEDLVQYDNKGNVIEGGMAYRDSYSLANNAYWYVNEYEGLDLYKLLLYLGMEDAETMGRAKSRTTLISFVAADGKVSSETFSAEALSYPEAFGFYNKNAADPGDGSYVPTSEDLVKAGYPVLLAYGVNRYPYTVNKGDEGYLSGLANSGGPIRVVFGKTQYNHPNGSNQVQYLSEVVAGEDVKYNTHQYTDNAHQKALSDSQLRVVVNSADGKRLSDSTLTVGQVEDIIYGEGVENNVKKAARVKGIYEVKDGDEYQSDVYEGIGLEYFLMNVVKLQGTVGTVTFSDGTKEMEVNLSDLFQEGYNASKGIDGQPALLAFAKNGAPLVKSAQDQGYVKEITLSPLSDSDPKTYPVNNSGGPLSVVIPSTTSAESDAQFLGNVTSITVNLEPDRYAHIEAPYSESAAQKIEFYGDGLEKKATYTVADLENRQTQAKTMDFSIRSEDGSVIEERYRGVGLYDLFTEIGIKSNAGDVIIHTADGGSHTLSLGQIKSKNGVNYVNPEKGSLYAILAYGTGKVAEDSKLGMPLVAGASSAGYAADYHNGEGPVKLVVPARTEEEANAAACLGSVVGVEVTANEIDTWGHAMSDVYSEFLDYEMTFTIRNDDHEWTHNFTVAQLESLTDLIVREEYAVLEIGTCEGIDIWKFIKLVAGNVPGIEDPISITAYASDGYKNDLLSLFYKEGFELGVLDANGDRKPLIIAYALNGYPIVDSENHEGYTGIAGNTAGPLRVIAETVQGASVKYFQKLVVTIPGSGPIDVQLPSQLQ